MDSELALLLDSRPTVWCMTTIRSSAGNVLSEGLRKAGVEYAQIAGDTVAGDWPLRKTTVLLAADEYRSGAIRSLAESKFSGKVVVWQHPGQHGHIVLSGDDQERVAKLDALHVRESSVENLLELLLTVCSPDLVEVSISPPERLCLSLEDHWHAMAEMFLRDLNALLTLSARQFEEFVAGLMEKEGYEVLLTKQTRDGGRDVVAKKLDFAGELVVVVECKRYAPDRKVDVNIVRNLFGVLQDSRQAARAVLATTSSFTSEAREFERRNSVLVTLRDNHSIHQWVRNVVARKLV